MICEWKHITFHGEFHILQELEQKLSKVIAELDQSQARQRAVEALLAGKCPEPRISMDQMKKQMAAVQELKVGQLTSPTARHN